MVTVVANFESEVVVCISGLLEVDPSWCTISLSVHCGTPVGPVSSAVWGSGEPGVISTAVGSTFGCI